MLNFLIPQTVCKGSFATHKCETKNICYPPDLLERMFKIDNCAHIVQYKYAHIVQDKYAHIVHAMKRFLATALLFAWSWHLAVDEIDVVDGHPGVELRGFLLLKTNLGIVEKWDKRIVIMTIS